MLRETYEEKREWKYFEDVSERFVQVEGDKVTCEMRDRCNGRLRKVRVRLRRDEEKGRVEKVKRLRG